MVIYLTAQEVLGMNERLVGPNKLRDFGLLDSAVHRPQTAVFGEDAYPSIHEKAAALLYGLARNHPFVDGNKRTALSAVNVFYAINGHIFMVEPGDLVSLMVDAAEGQLDVPAIAGRLKDWATEIDINFDPFA